MKKLWIWITVGVVAVVGAGIGIAYAMGLFDKKKDNDTDPTPVAVTEVSINGASAIAVNTATTYTAVVLPADATVKTVTWAVTDGAAITSGGVLTATETGDVTITATSNNGKVGSKTITVCADQGTADVAIAKAAIEGTTFTAPQADAMGMGAANDFIQNIIDGLLPNGVTADIMEGTFNAAIAGTVSEPNGTDGSYTFTVTLNTGLATEQNTITLTLTITATNITTQNNADITAAKGIVENATYAANQATVTNTATANAAVQSVLGGLQLNGVTTAIVDGTFTAATAGAVGTPIGTKGSFTFNVKLNKGSGTEQTTGILTLDIIATPFDDAARIAAAKTAIEDILDNAEYSATTCDTNQHTREYIEGLLSTVGSLTEEGGLYEVRYNVNVQPFTPAVVGTVQNAAGTDGSAGIEVTITRGGEPPEPVTRTKTIVTTTIFTDNDTIEDARTKISLAMPTAPILASASNNSLNAMHDFVNSECDAVKTTHDITYNITDENFEAAVNGTMPDIGSETAYIGKDGIYTCTITIEKNDGTPRILAVRINIKARNHVTPGLAFATVTVDGEVGLEVSASGLTEASVIIPSEHINGERVLRIANGGFQSANGIKLVIISEGVKEIGTNAFAYCSGLQYVAIPDTIETILDGAFQDCTGLESITLPENPKYTTITTDAFRNTGLKSIILPGKVTTINSTAFFGCAELTDVAMDGVTTIGNGAFNGCSKLVDLTLSQNVESIGGGAFYNINIVLHIENPNIEFRGNAFSANTMVEIYFNGTQTVFDALVIHTAGAPTTTTVSSTLPEKTKVYFKDPSAAGYDPNTGYTAAVIYNQQP